MSDYSCTFEIWDVNLKKLRRCGEQADKYSTPRNTYFSRHGIPNGYVCLCSEHFDFVKDSVDKSEIWRAHDSLPHCVTCSNYSNKDKLVKPTCTKGKSNLSNFPFRFTKCRYYKGD